MPEGSKLIEAANREMLCAKVCSAMEALMAGNPSASPEVISAHLLNTLLPTIDGLHGELQEARRRRDEWRKKAEGFDSVCIALREKVGAPWPPHLSRALWAGIAAAEKKRADDAEAERDAALAELARLREANQGDAAALARVVRQVPEGLYGLELKWFPQADTPASAVVMVESGPKAGRWIGGDGDTLAAALTAALEAAGVEPPHD